MHDGPAQDIEPALPTAGLVAHVLAGKYADHRPLYRQPGIYRRAGLELDRGLFRETEIVGRFPLRKQRLIIEAPSHRSNVWS